LRVNIIAEQELEGEETEKEKFFIVLYLFFCSIIAHKKIFYLASLLLTLSMLLASINLRPELKENYFH
jgi:hypothetical protein